MSILLDTHAFLWIVGGDPRLSNAARDCFLDPLRHVFLSATSAWEIAIKLSLGRLELPENLESLIATELQTNAIRWLPITAAHCQRVTNLPFHHRDPFDRMLAAQAICERLDLLSQDRVFQEYGVHQIW